MWGAGAGDNGRRSGPGVDKQDDWRKNAEGFDGGKSGASSSDFDMPSFDVQHDFDMNATDSHIDGKRSDGDGRVMQSSTKQNNHAAVSPSGLLSAATGRVLDMILYPFGHAGLRRTAIENWFFNGVQSYEEYRRELIADMRREGKSEGEIEEVLATLEARVQFLRNSYAIRAGSVGMAHAVLYAIYGGFPAGCAASLFNMVTSGRRTGNMAIDVRSVLKSGTRYSLLVGGVYGIAKGTEHYIKLHRKKYDVLNTFTGGAVAGFTLSWYIRTVMNIKLPHAKARRAWPFQCAVTVGTFFTVADHVIDYQVRSTVTNLICSVQDRFGAR
jgi:hypothetical protein